MNAKELTVEVEALKALVAKLVEANTALEQRTHNFAAKVTAVNKIQRAEITRLRDTVEALPGRKHSVERIPLAEYTAARNALGAGYHSRAAILDMACKMKVAQPQTETEDEFSI